MDRVRLGRVLGRGARLAARTAWEVLDAATAAPPAGSPPPSTAGHGPQKSTMGSPAQRQRQVVEAGQPRQVVQGQVVQGQVVQGQVVQRGQGQTQRVTQVRPPGRLAPLRRASRAVSLEVTGSFFALFAFSFGVGLWRGRDQLHAGHAGVARFALFCAVTAFFAYFSISNFVRARRLQ